MRNQLTVNPWDRSTGDSTLNEEIREKHANYKVLHPWDQPTGNSVDEAALKNAARDYRIHHPWDHGDEKHQLDEFDLQLAALDVGPITQPWEEGSRELRQLHLEKEKAKNYKFTSLFEPPPLTEAQKKVIAEYQYNPPFNTDLVVNKEVENNKANRPSKKKIIAEKVGQRTRDPWTYGSLPGDPVTAKVFEKPGTVLWDVVPDKKAPTHTTMESSGDPVLDSLRSQLLSHGASGISGLARKFRIMDDDGSGSLSWPEFEKGMKELKMCFLSPAALKHLFKYFDDDDSGSISFDEFMVGVRGVLNSRRKAMVRMAFDVLDADNSGSIDLNDIKGVFNGKSHPDFLAGSRSEDEILQDFLGSFARNKKDKTARDEIRILPKDFEDYYANISASIDSDDYFELMIRNAWHISGGEGACANTTNRRVLVTHADGRQTVEEVKNDIKMGALSNAKRQQAIANNITSQPGLQQVQVMKGYAEMVDNNSRRNSREGVNNNKVSSTRGGDNKAPAPYKNSLAAFAARQSELKNSKS
mmetsp:Transcript_9390/g.13004  ORF Transcript_9390/g.13004 Transcript_9390/m.13004 type:complete len:528 (+) Transcript_9390:39-1622(+)